jgi:hypothetical protein
MLNPLKVQEGWPTLKTKLTLLLTQSSFQLTNFDIMLSLYFSSHCPNLSINLHSIPSNRLNIIKESYKKPLRVNTIH